MEPPIDKGWAWVALVGVWLSCFMMVGGAKSLGILFVEFIEMFDSSNSMTAWTLGFVLLFLSLVAPISTKLGDVYSYRLMVAIGGILTAAGFILASLMNNIWAVVCTFGPVTGIGYGFIYTSSMMVVSKYFEKKRPLATGIAVSGGSIGQLVTPLLIRALVDHYGLRGALLVFAGINLNVLVAAALMTPFSFYTKKGKRSNVTTSREKEETKHPAESDIVSENKAYLYRMEINKSTGSLRIALPVDKIDQRKEKTRNDEKKQYGMNEDQVSFIEDESEAFDISYNSKNTTCWKKYRVDCSLLRRWVFVFYTIGLCLTYIAYMNPIIFVPAYAKDLGVDSFMRSLLISIIGICDFVGRLTSGWLGNLGIIKRNILLALTQTTSSVILIIATFFPSFAAALVISISHGIFAGALFSLSSVILVDFLGLENLSSSLGLSFMFLGMVQAPMPPILGYIRDMTGSYDGAFYLCGIIGIIGSVFFVIEPCGRRLDNK